MNDEPKTPLRTGQGMDYGEQADVQQVHAAVQREKREPRVGPEPLSLWLIAIYGLAIFFGGGYLGRYSGNFIGDGLDPSVRRRRRRSRPRRTGAASKRSFRRAIGREDFRRQLRDLPSAYRSRRGRPISAACWFRISIGGWRRPAMIVLKGLQGPVTVKGQHYGSAVMQPWDKTLTDQKIS